jgi:hypothetical protein
MSVYSGTTPKHRVVKVALCNGPCADTPKTEIDDTASYIFVYYCLNTTCLRVLTVSEILVFFTTSAEKTLISLTRCTPYIIFACITYRLQREAGRCYLAATTQTGGFRVPFVHWYFTWSAGPDSNVQYTNFQHSVIFETCNHKARSNLSTSISRVYITESKSAI